MLEWLRFSVTALLLLFGLFIVTMGVVGQYRFHFCLNRIHFASMGDTLGLLLGLLALCVSTDDPWTIFKMLLIIVFLWTASPVSGHLIARLEVTTDESLKSKAREERR